MPYSTKCKFTLLEYVSRSKKEHLQGYDKKGSLKLRINASQQWKDNICAQH